MSSDKGQWATYIYRNGVDGKILYVGVTSHASKRRAHHRSGGAVWTYQHDGMGRPILGDFVEPEVTFWADEVAARAAEAAWIATVNPLYNKKR